DISFYDVPPGTLFEVSIVDAHTPGQIERGGPGDANPLPVAGHLDESVIFANISTIGTTTGLYIYETGIGFYITSFNNVTGELLHTSTTLDLSVYEVSHIYRTLFYDPITGNGKLRWSEGPEPGV